MIFRIVCAAGFAIACLAATAVAGEAVAASRAAFNGGLQLSTAGLTTAEADTEGDDAEGLADDMLKKAQELSDKMLKKAGSDAKAKPDDAAASGPAEDLQPLADNKAPVPVPSTAEGVEYEAADGTLEFMSSSNVKSVVAFYRNSLKPLGWKESKSVIDKPNMVVLNFAKDGKDLSFTVMQMGQATNVSANGSGLVTAKEETETNTAAAPDGGGSDASSSSGDTPSKLTESDLVADEGEGLPYPKQHSSAGHSSTPFRVGADASVPANVEAVLGFYRRELGKLGWKEETATSVVKPDSAEVHFATADGPAMLKLGRNNNETTVDLLVRKEAEAKKSGQMPSAGKAKLILGNILDSESTITINKQTIKVKAEAGKNGPGDGPSLELAPGKYAYTIKSKGKSEQKDEIEVKGDEIWGLMIGPGGGLALQMY